MQYDTTVCTQQPEYFLISCPVLYYKSSLICLFVSILWCLPVYLYIDVCIRVLQGAALYPLELGLRDEPVRVRPTAPTHRAARAVSKDQGGRQHRTMHFIPIDRSLWSMKHSMLNLINAEP